MADHRSGYGWIVGLDPILQGRWRGNDLVDVQSGFLKSNPTQLAKYQPGAVGDKVLHQFVKLSLDREYAFTGLPVAVNLLRIGEAVKSDRWRLNHRFWRHDIGHRASHAIERNDIHGLEPLRGTHCLYHQDRGLGDLLLGKTAFQQHLAVQEGLATGIVNDEAELVEVVKIFHAASKDCHIVISLMFSVAHCNRALLR